MSIDTLKNLFQNLGEFGDSAKEWVAQVISSAITADKMIDSRENLYLEELLNEKITGIALDKDRTVGLAIRKSFHNNKNIAPPPTKFPEKISEEIIFCVLEICICDKEFHSDEIQFVKALGSILGIDEGTIRRYIKLAAVQMKPQSLDVRIPDLSDDQKHWLAGITFKLIGADERIDSNEVWYLKDVYKLIEDPSALFETIKKDVENRFLEILPKVRFEHEDATHILEYLLGISGVDGDFDQRELGIVKQVAEQLEYSEEQLEGLIKFWTKRK